MKITFVNNCTPPHNGDPWFALCGLAIIRVTTLIVTRHGGSTQGELKEHEMCVHTSHQGGCVLTGRGSLADGVAGVPWITCPRKKDDPGEPQGQRQHMEVTGWKWALLAKLS